MVELEGVFEACVAQLNSGTPLDTCLAMYPAEANRLSPLLRVVINLQGLASPAPAMDPWAAQAARARFLARASALSQPAEIALEDAFEQSTAMIAAGALLEDCLDQFPHHAAELRPMLQTLASLQQVHQPAPAADPVARSAARELFLARAVALSQPPSVPVEEALDASLRMAAAGATIEECLQAFPHYAHELRSDLAIAAALQAEVAMSIPARPVQTVTADREAFVGSARAARRATRAQRTTAGWIESLAGLFRQPAWARAAVLMLVVLLTVAFGSVAVTVASDALPGDALYPVKLAVEQTRLLVTTDQNQRATLREQFDQTRREEAAVVTEQRRQVLVQFPGVIESMVDDVWRIVGLDLPVLVPGDAVVRGQPAVGAHVIILAYSDGSGSLVARQVLVLAPAAPLPPTATATSTPTRTPTIEPPALAPPLPPATSTWTPEVRPGVTRTRTASPTLTPTPTATATPSGTPTPTGTPTSTATPSVTATPTWTPLPRPVTFYGAIQEKSPTWWMVGGRGVLITPDTLIDESQGPAEIGANVQIEGMEQPDGSLVALVIRVQPSPVDTERFTGIIYEMGSSQWFIGNRWVVVDGSTEVIGNPAVGKSAIVDARRISGGPWTATRIEVEEPEQPVQFEGVISAIGASSWVVAGQTVTITADTVITGLPPQVGLYAEVVAMPSNGLLLALSIEVKAATPTPTSTPTATPEPPTATPEPPTATPEPPTATPEPPTATPEPPTATPEPPTATPEPPTATPEPASATPTPTPTIEPADAPRA